MVVECKNIVKRFGELEVLRGVNLAVDSGQVVAIIGRSGAGKSTLLQILGTLLPADSGQIVVGGVDLSSMKDNELSDFRASKIGFVFQFHHLLPEFTALENVALAGYIAHRPKSEALGRAGELLCRMGLEGRLHHKPSALSGGEQQRVAVARALINEPAVVLADEPTGNLDSASRSQLNELFFELARELNQTFIIVTHESDLSAMAHRTLTIEDGVFL